MLESITIFNKGGWILYQYRANPSVLGAGEGAANSAAFTEARLNAWMQKELLGRKQQTSQVIEQRHDAMEAVQQAARSVAVLTESVTSKDKIAVALYPDIFFDGPRQYLKGWISTLLQRSLDEYNLYEQAMLHQQQHDNTTTNETPDRRRHRGW